MDWFTADPHFGHANIIDHCGRPFETVIDMDNYIIHQWNKIWTPGDKLFILGDFCGQRRQAKWMQGYLDRLAMPIGQIVLILGNHDNEKECRKLFPHVHTRHTYRHLDKWGGIQYITLDHYCMRTWNGSAHGRWHLYGHSHGNLEEDPTALSFDCGVDSNSFYPWSYDQVANKMKTKIPHWWGAPALDHHVKKRTTFNEPIEPPPFNRSIKETP